MSRTVRRLPEEQRGKEEALKLMVGTPWNPRLASQPGRKLKKEKKVRFVPVPVGAPAAEAEVAKDEAAVDEAVEAVKAEGVATVEKAAVPVDAPEQRGQEPSTRGDRSRSPPRGAASSSSQQQPEAARVLLERPSDESAEPREKNESSHCSGCRSENGDSR